MKTKNHSSRSPLTHHELATLVRKRMVAKHCLGLLFTAIFLVVVALSAQAQGPAADDWDWDGIPDRIEESILTKYVPWLYFDCEESFWPCSAEWFVQHSDLIHVPGVPGEIIEQNALENDPESILYLYGGRWSRATPSSGLKLNINDDYRGGRFSFPYDPMLSRFVPIYGAMMPLPRDWRYACTFCFSNSSGSISGPFQNGAYLVQYWILFAYDYSARFDALWPDAGSHEGDIVWLDLILDEYFRPLYIVYHHHGDGNLPPSVVPWDSRYLHPDYGVPIAYLEAGTHELWEEPGGDGSIWLPWGAQIVIDSHWGDGVRYRPTWVWNVGQAGFPMWSGDPEIFLQFNGSWGDFTGVGQDNPGGPLNQGNPAMTNNPAFPINVPSAPPLDFQIVGARDIMQDCWPDECDAIVRFTYPFANELRSGVTNLPIVTCSPPSGSFFPVGTNTVHCRTMEPYAPAAFTNFNVIVRDIRPPFFVSAAAEPLSIGPPDGSMHDVNLTCIVRDPCYDRLEDELLQPMISVSCNEPTSGAGDAYNSPDWVIDSSSHIRLRAKRSRGGQGRVYTVTFTACDNHGNCASTNIHIPVEPYGVKGFGVDGHGWTLSSGNCHRPYIYGDVLYLTSEDDYWCARSAFYNTPQRITQFNAAFTYQNLTGPGQGGLNNPANGVVFTLQNQGPDAVGGCCNALGYRGITNASGVAVNIDGSLGQTAYAPLGTEIGPYLDTSISLRSGRPIRVTLTYDGQNLTETLQDTIGLTGFTTTYAATGLVAAVGGPTAYVGFTGGTGQGAADQRISDFTFWTGPALETSQQFRNLDFEAAFYSTQPRPWTVATTLALPGWIPFARQLQTTNDYPLGSVFLNDGATRTFPPVVPGMPRPDLVTIQDNESRFRQPIQGRVSVRLEGEPSGGGIVILGVGTRYWGGVGQTGLVPTSAGSLRFRLSGDDVNLTISGQRISYTALYTNGDTRECSADILSFAGKLVELKFITAGLRTDLDYIRFVDRGTNHSPVVQREVFRAGPENVSESFSLSEILGSIRDDDGDVLTLLSTDAVSAKGGTVRFDGTWVVYEPARDFVGRDEFAFVVSDSYGGLVSNMVTVIVLSRNVNGATVTSGPAMTDGKFIARFAGIPGATYTVQSTENLANPLWTYRTNLVAPTQNQGLGIGIFEFVDRVNTATNRFYRAILNVGSPTICAFKLASWWMWDVSAGEPVTITYTVADSGGPGLQQVELWRESNFTGAWSVSQTNSHSGTGSVSNSFSESPAAGMTYRYSLRVVDVNGVSSTESDFGLPQIWVTVVAGVPQLSLSPSNALTFGGIRGGPFLSDNTGFTVSNIGGGVLHWTATADQHWLEVSGVEALNGPLNPSFPAYIWINTNANSLARGTYSSTLTFRGNGGNTTRQIQLNVW